MGNKNSSSKHHHQTSPGDSQKVKNHTRDTQTKKMIKHTSSNGTPSEDASGEKLADDLTDAFYHIEREGIHCHRSLKNELVNRWKLHMKLKENK